MSSQSMAQRIEYEEIVENIDMEEVLEGTRWEESYDTDEPMAKEIFGLLGAMGGYALGEILGRLVGGMIDQELEALDERNAEQRQAADSAEEGQEQTDPSVGTGSGTAPDPGQQETTVDSGDQTGSPPLREDEKESTDEEAEMGGGFQ